MEKNRNPGSKHEAKDPRKNMVGKVTDTPAKKAAGHTDKDASRQPKVAGKAHEQHKKH